MVGGFPSCYRFAMCCRTCGAVGDYLQDGMWFCRRHRRPVGGWRVCDDYLPPSID